jgi:hypothetical protein
VGLIGELRWGQWGALLGASIGTLRRVVILKTEDSTQEQVSAAAAKIEHDVPGVETVLLEFEFNIKDNLGVREPD